jgi:hypothetical protein
MQACDTSALPESRSSNLRYSELPNLRHFATLPDYTGSLAAMMAVPVVSSTLAVSSFLKISR